MGGPRGLSLAERIARHCREDISGCWIWQGPTNGRGYGRITVNRRSAYVHRVAYEEYRGAIPPGLQIDHLCRNTLCANPWHMEPVEPAENRARQAAATPLRSTCRSGRHALDSINTYVSPSGLRICRACQRDNRKKKAS